MSGVSRKVWVMRKAPVSTGSEMRLRQRMTGEGWRFFSQYMIACEDDGQRYGLRVDFLVFFRGGDVVVEVKGKSHSWARQVEKDEWRENLLRKTGYRVVSVTDEEVKRDIEGCIARIRG